MLLPLTRRIALSLTALVFLSCQTGRQLQLLEKYQAAYDEGRYKEALVPATDLLAIAERTKNPTARIQALERAGELELKRRNKDRAREIYGRALQEAEKQSPAVPELLAEALLGMAEVQLLEEDFAAAEASLRRSIDLCEASGDSRITRVLNALGRTYSLQERYPEAVEVLKRSLEIAEQRFGADRPEVVDPARELAKIYRIQKRSDEAVALLERAVAIDAGSRPPAHPSAIASLEVLASIYNAQDGYHERAQAIREDLVARLQAAYGPESEEALVQRYKLVNLQINNADYQKSQRDMEALVVPFERTLGTDAEATVELYSNLCRLDVLIRAFDQAEPICLQASRGPRGDRSWKPRSWRERWIVGAALKQLGTLYSDSQRYAEADAAFEDAQALLEVAWPASEARGGLIMLGLVLSAQGYAYLQQRNPERAIPLFEHSLRVAEEATGEFSNEASAALAALADAERVRGNRERAATLYSRALQIGERIWGPNHPQLGELLQGVANTCDDPCPAGDRLELAQRAVELRQKAFGAGSVWTTAALQILARIRAERGDHRGALTPLREVAEILEKAEPLRPWSTSALLDLGWQQALAGAPADALRTFERMEEREEEQLRIFLGGVSEPRQRAFLDGARTNLDWVVAFQQRWMPADERAQRLVLRALLRRKARALEVTAAQLAAAQRGSAESRQSLQALGQVRSELAELLLGAAANSSPARVAELRQEQDRLEAVVAAQLGTSAPMPVTVESVGAAIPPRSALLELVRYFPTQSKPARYAAYLLKDGGRQIRSRDLGDAARLEKQIAALRSALAAPSGNSHEPARRLDRALLEPLEGLLADVDHLYVAGDGAFHLVPFGALRDRRGRFRVERWEFLALDSGRDLLRPSQGSPGEATTAALVMGGALFDQQAEDSTAPVSLAQLKPSTSRNLLSRDFGTRRFGPLPATRAEATEVAAALGVLPVLGDQASEARIKRARSPLVLHVATHAFFLKDLARATESGSGGRESSGPVSEEPETPMLRSGLALTGANLHRSDGEDGILTALEASTLDLEGTELVTLSACDTGVGEIDQGEGVIGLRRAFALAGARSLLLSLWSVSDEGTRRFMTAYYRRIVGGEGRAAALRAVQREFLADPLVRDPYYWASFVLTGVPGPVPELTGNPPAWAARTLGNR